MVDHERIWLEPELNSDPYEGRQWCQHNVWGDEATEYVRADLEAALASPAEVVEPVAWMHPTAGWASANYSSVLPHCRNDGPKPVPLYLHPPQQEPARLREEDWQVEYEVLMVDGDFCASSTSLPDAKHYAAMYQQDGPVEIVEVRRRKLAEDGL